MQFSPSSSSSSFLNTSSICSSSTILYQALKSYDIELLHKTLATTDPSVIRPTLSQLPHPYPLHLLRFLLSQFQAGGMRVLAVGRWAQELLNLHAVSIGTDGRKEVEQLYCLVVGRLQTQGSLVKLQAKVEAVLGQVAGIRMRKAKEEERKAERKKGGFVFVDGEEEKEMDGDVVEGKGGGDITGGAKEVWVNEVVGEGDMGEKKQKKKKKVEGLPTLGVGDVEECFAKEGQQIERRKGGDVDMLEKSKKRKKAREGTHICNETHGDDELGYAVIEKSRDNESEKRRKAAEKGEGGGGGEGGDGRLKLGKSKVKTVRCDKKVKGSGVGDVSESLLSEGRKGAEDGDSGVLVKKKKKMKEKDGYMTAA
eukprot:GHVQ01018349.1.p1 GENE.GHVQ01018349.1~~GHVQ01018349.1.p1  ORF type:complete len:387 (+),score=122.51 GHVQ01018349.1:63-1163(+)